MFFCRVTLFSLIRDLSALFVLGALILSRNHAYRLPPPFPSLDRYLTPKECGCAALVVVLLWLILGRYGERNIGRSYERVLMERSTIPRGTICSGGGGHHRPPLHTPPLTDRMRSNVSLGCQRLRDCVCPLFLQRLVYVPAWNRRGQIDIARLIAAYRSEDCRGRG